MEATEKVKLAVVDYWRTGMPYILLIGDGRLIALPGLIARAHLHQVEKPIANPFLLPIRSPKLTISSRTAASISRRLPVQARLVRPPARTSWPRLKESPLHRN